MPTGTVLPIATVPPTVINNPVGAARHVRVGCLGGSRIAALYIGAGFAMVPWLFVLAATLPRSAVVEHWDATWVGLDCLEAAGLFVTGLLLRRGDARASLAAVFSAALLLVDAWLDVTTAAPGADWMTALAMAALAELPTSALCFAVAMRKLPRDRPREPSGRCAAPGPR